MASEKYSNAGVTTLNGGINDSVTSLVVTSAATFPSTPQFRITIGSEIMIVTGVAGTTYTVTRAAEGTSAAAHSNGDAITEYLTKGALDQIISDNTQQGVVASVFTTEKAGRTYHATDVPFTHHDNGSAISAAYRMPITKPVLGNWTLTNAKSGGTLATLTTTYGMVQLYGPADTADDMSMALKAIPSAPYTATFWLRGNIWNTNYSAFGVLWRNSANGHIKTLAMESNSGINVTVGNGTDGSAHLTAVYANPISLTLFEWFRLADDNTNQLFQVSNDGFNWITIYSHARNTTVTPDTLGFFVNPRNAISRPVACSLVSYKEA